MRNSSPVGLVTDLVPKGKSLVVGQVISPHGKRKIGGTTYGLRLTPLLQRRALQTQKPQLAQSPYYPLYYTKRMGQVSRCFVSKGYRLLRGFMHLERAWRSKEVEVVQEVV